MIENSKLNTSGPLPDGTEASMSGGSGDGNSPSMAALRRGFLATPDPETPPRWLPQNADDGENYVGDGMVDGGFLTRPEGWER